LHAKIKLDGYARPIPRAVWTTIGKYAKIWLDVTGFLETKSQFSSLLNKMLINVYPSKFVVVGSTPFAGTILPGVPVGRTGWLSSADCVESMRLTDVVGSSGLVSVAAGALVLETAVYTRVDPERNGKSLGVITGTGGEAPVACGAAAESSDAVAESEAPLGKLMTTVDGNTGAADGASDGGRALLWSTECQ
jgi:hypothetical protein